MKLISKTFAIAASLAFAASAAFADDTNKICPIMVEDEIDEEEFSDYEGKKVFFCCGTCKKSFDANPKYIIKVAGEALPQYKGMDEKLKLAEVELLEQKFCPIYSDSLITPDSPTVEYKGKKIYLFKKRAVAKWKKDPEGNFKTATEAGLLPQFDENKKQDDAEQKEAE
jgi:YHS domain-containing protein